MGRKRGLIKMMDDKILDFFKKNPNTGLYDVSAWIYTQDPSIWQRNATPHLACRKKVQKRIEVLYTFGYLNRYNDGRRSVYTVRDD